jgi:hypothetical protein
MEKQNTVKKSQKKTANGEKELGEVYTRHTLWVERGQRVTQRLTVDKQRRSRA